MTLHAVTSQDVRADAAPAVAVFLHGYGSNEHDLVTLASALPEGMPWASLRGPIALAPATHAWFRIGEPGNPDPIAVAAATAAIWTWADAALPADTRLVPIGFSQGGLMASQLLRTDPSRVLAPVMLGAFVQAGEQPGDAQLRETRPAAFSGRGSEDRVIAAAAVARTDAWLPAHTSAVARSYSGLAHGINAQELADVHAFLAAETAMVNR